MKRLSFLLAALLLACAGSFAQSLKGDVNEDGVVDVADVVSVINIMQKGGGETVLPSSVELESTSYMISVNQEIQLTAKILPTNATDKSLTWTSSTPSVATVTQEGVVKGTPSLSTTATKTSPVGTYPIVVKAGSVSNTKVTFVSGTLTITKAPLTVGVNNVEIEQGEDIPAFTLTYSRFRNNDTESNAFSTKPTATTVATKNSEPGNYYITVSGGSATNYELSYQKGILTIKAPTGIEEITNSSETHKQWYDLSGRKIGKTTKKGLYISNGTKIVVK